MKLTKSKSNLLIVIVTVMWGAAFVLVKYCIGAGMSAGLINVFRGGILMLLSLAVFGKKIVKMTKKDALIGAAIGVVNAGAYIIQSIGLQYAAPSTSAFLTILYIVLVPLIALILYKKKPQWQLLPAIVIAIGGAIILTNTNFSNFNFGKGEWLTLGGTLLFALDIVLLGEGAKNTPSEVVTFWMGLTQMLLALIPFFVFEYSTAANIDWKMAIIPLLLLCVFGTFFTNAAQVFCQKVTDETTASMIMTMEAVFATIFSLALGYEKFTWQLLVGGLLIFVGVLIAVVDFKRIFHKKQR